MVPGAGGGEEKWEMTAHGHGDGVSFGGLRMFWNQIQVVLAQHWELDKCH